MSKQLDGKRVAILATDGFEESELAVPQSTLRSYGVEVHVVAPSKDGIRAWAETDWGDTYEVDKALDQAQAEDYHALVLPGGLFNPDELRLNEQALDFVRAFFKAGKPVAAICHGAQLLAAAGVLEGRKCSAYPACQPEVELAGGTFASIEVDQAVTDANLVTAPAWPAHPAWLAQFFKLLDQ